MGNAFYSYISTLADWDPVKTIFLCPPADECTTPEAAEAFAEASGWGGGFLPIDGLPAMILGMGKYKLKQFMAYSVPMYLIQILGLAVGAVIAFGL